MLQRRARSALRAANDNLLRACRGQPRLAPMVAFAAPASSEPFRLGARSLPIAGFAGLVLLTLSGALLMGLAAVGVVAVAVAVRELVRRQVRRWNRLGPRQMMGCR